MKRGKWRRAVKPGREVHIGRPREPKPKKLRAKIKARSDKRAKEEREYLRESRPWLAERPLCESRLEPHNLGGPCILATSEVHHKAGRVGFLLLYKPLWLAVCAGCHRWITDNGKAAQARGLRVILPPGWRPTE